MANLIGSILRKITRNDVSLNILTTCTHERWESNLCKTNHNFYAVQHPTVKGWNSTYAPIPSNYTLLNKDKTDNQIPAELDIDIVLSQNKFGSFQLLAPIAKQLNVPFLSIEHTCPYSSWPEEYILQIKQMKADVNIFISEWSRGKWKWGDEAKVIHHGIDTDIFKYSDKPRKPVLFSCVNDWINRNEPCGFDTWQQVSKDFPVKVLGATPGLSEPAKSIDDLVNHYQTSRVFLNTSRFSPIPTVVLEAMACGAAVVTTNNSMLPEIIEHGKNGLISNDIDELRGFCQQLLTDEKYAAELGKNARRTIEQKFSLAKFVENWNNVFREVTNV